MSQKKCRTSYQYPSKLHPPILGSELSHNTSLLRTLAPRSRARKATWDCHFSFSEVTIFRMKDAPRRFTIWTQILATAVYAPSPHNAQPWRIKILNDQHAILYVERARMMPDLDPTGHFILSSMAMFVEAMTIVAANDGWTLNHQLLDRNVSGPLIPFAQLELQHGSEPSIFPDELFRKRVTSRLGSNGQRIHPDTTTFLSGCNLQFGQRYRQLDDSAIIRTLVEENIRAIFQDMNDFAYHREIVNWFRYSRAESESKADGLDYRCMGLSATELKLMKHFPQVMKWKLTRPLMHRMYRRQLGKVAHLGVINGLFFDDVGCMDAGIYLLRFWLELARRDLYIHPLGSLVTNHQAKARVDELTGLKDVWLIFRIGYTSEPPEKPSAIRPGGSGRCLNACSSIFYCSFFV